MWKVEPTAFKVTKLLIFSVCPKYENEDLFLGNNGSPFVVSKDFKNVTMNVIGRR